MDKMTAAERARFDGKYAVSGRGCWEWTGQTDRDGYGVFYFRRMNRRAHRVSYWSSVGEIPDGCVVDHTCGNPGCVRPEHLRCLTHRENVLSGRGPASENAKKTTCPRGHAYDRFYGKQRYCSVCEREKRSRLNKKWRAEDKIAC